MPKGSQHLQKQHYADFGLDYAPLFELPIVKKLTDGRYIVIDRRGHVMRAQSQFLQHLWALYPPTTLRTYVFALLDVERSLAAYFDGKGLPYYKANDAFFERLRVEHLDVRGNDLKTFSRIIMIYFRYLQFAQDQAWASGLIGKGPNFNVVLPPTGYIDHPVLAGERIDKIPELPTHRDLELVEACAMDLFKTPRLKRRFSILCQMTKDYAFRRSEGLGITIQQIPTRERLEELRIDVEQGRQAPIQPVPVLRSKGGGVRDANFTLSLLEEIRDYIDVHRKHDLKKGVSTDAVFVSLKTGKQLTPQWFTNIYKRAARKAASEHPRKFGQMSLATLRPHHSRHRGITDLLRGYLQAGMDPNMAILMTMDLVGIRSLDVVTRYLHLAEAELEEDSEEFRAASHAREERAKLDLNKIREVLRQKAGGRK